VLVIGYVVMRLTTVANWIRAGRADAVHRTTAYRYATGIVVIQLLWVGRLWLPDHLAVGSFVVLALLEMAIPAVAERSGVTPYHPAHIAERYGLFTTIVLGESVVAVVVTLDVAVDEADHRATLIAVAVAGICILFSMWWLYFDKPADGILNTLRSSLIWGYGHYLIFGSVAAVGVGLTVFVEHDVGEFEISARLAGAAVAVPVAIFLVVVWALHLRHRHTPLASAAFPVTAALVALAPLTGAAVYVVAVLLLALVTVTVVTSRGPADRTAARVLPGRPAAVR
jgi:low temperature requirement protein LtrA